MEQLILAILIVTFVACLILGWMLTRIYNKLSITALHTSDLSYSVSKMEKSVSQALGAMDQRQDNIADFLKEAEAKNVEMRDQVADLLKLTVRMARIHIANREKGMIDELLKKVLQRER